MELFLYKIKDSNDRDCIAYIDSTPSKFECNHYFSGINIEGSCYSISQFEDYENIKTILTKNEYEQLLQFKQDIEDLGFGIEKGDKRYNKGLKLIEDIEPIYEKLKSNENQELFDEIAEEEMEYLKNEYYLNDEDIKDILSCYGLDYKDRSIISYVYGDREELGEDYCYNTMNIPAELENYIDYEAIGSDLLLNGDYLELEDGRIVELAY
ncbi:antirestriction protein ArdA [Peptoniphilus sp. MSJ-1]|uniref:Antirestriction protein ArdA n=1 Tax=Peptoniphilus ovalis TaxID=2841503 RepID=A0ABS6FHW3_9FIRM|nr:antirestriction protein ArdA [Peptoniphilus ovalis]MBU5669633.1 antirestriction protein ArdA [Peptoniphilus ovalis]